MNSFTELLQQGTAHAWLFIPSAILLGALHGLEPGHSKTMMAAFIVAIRGTVKQAVLLGLAATLSHTAVVWAVALVGLHPASQFNAEATEPYFQLGSAVLIIGIAVWMLIRTWRDQQDRAATASHEHGHHDDVKRVETGSETVLVEVFETGVPPRFRLRFEKRGRAIRASDADSFTIDTIRADGTTQSFRFAGHDGFLESLEEIPEPHAFTARLRIGHPGHEHRYDMTFTEDDHDHGLDVSDPGFQDAHERAHADEIKQRFAGRNITTGQIVMFGLTGGLIPCPASITVLLLCLQLKQYSLGIVLVLCFSIGLALTMVASGTFAALSVRHVSKRFSGFGAFANKAPYFSSVLIVAVGIYTARLGLIGLGIA